MSETPVNAEICTIGHSDHSYEKFLDLLNAHGVSALADVRSSPYSRRAPHFNREVLKDELLVDGIAYVFLGDALGGRPKDATLFRRGAADYEAMAEEPTFKVGIDRLMEGIKRHRIALMCSERDPLECHRCLLVSRALKANGLAVVHILSSGTVVNHDQIEEDLLVRAGNPKAAGVIPRDLRLREAYREQAARVAFPAPRAPKEQMDLL